jgi:hypothetical protein
MKQVTVFWINGASEIYQCEDDGVYQTSHGLVLTLVGSGSKTNIPLISVLKWVEQTF